MYAIKNRQLDQDQETDFVPGKCANRGLHGTMKKLMFRTSPLDMSKYSLASSISVGQLEEISSF